MARTARSFEVHEHSYVSGPNANRGKQLVHSHEGGSEPHGHQHTGPASYTIDKDEWFAATGLRGGSRKEFTKAPKGEQLPIVALEDWQTSFEIHHGEPPPGWQGTGGGHATAARMVLGSRMTISNIIPFPGKRGAA